MIKEIKEGLEKMKFNTKFNSEKRQTFVQIIYKSFLLFIPID